MFQQGSKGFVTPSEFITSPERAAVGTCEPIDVAATSYTSVVVCADGSVFTMGSDTNNGLLGIDNSVANYVSKYYTKIKVTDGSLFTSVMCTHSQCLARGGVFNVGYTWGANEYVTFFLNNM
jgi:alpha-tubulin suppressor-like RCC1 family protein